MADAGIPLPSNWYRISYFHCSLLGYFLGLLTATISSEVNCVF
jgi:signal peptide peptidase-like protein 3